MTVAELNGYDRQRFVDTLGAVFEASPWVAERAWSARPFADVDALHAAMAQAVESATEEEQLRLLHAHPDLGARLRMSEASVNEQAGAGLDRLSAGAFEQLQRLNAAYRAKFGFPFLFAVKGSSADDVLRALQARLPRTREEEFAEALRQVFRIAWFRIEAMFSRSA